MIATLTCGSVTSTTGSTSTVYEITPPDATDSTHGAYTSFGYEVTWNAPPQAVEPPEPVRHVAPPPPLKLRHEEPALPLFGSKSLVRARLRTRCEGIGVKNFHKVGNT